MDKIQSGHHLIIGCDGPKQGSIVVTNFGETNSYVITGLDYVLDHTEEFLTAVKEQRDRRDS